MRRLSGGQTGLAPDERRPPVAASPPHDPGDLHLPVNLLAVLGPEELKRLAAPGTGKRNRPAPADPRAIPAATRGPRLYPHPEDAIMKIVSKAKTEYQDQHTRDAPNT
jgi:hypothetical protein